MFSLMAIISKNPISHSEIERYIMKYYQNFYVLYTMSLMDLKVQSIYCDDNKVQRKLLAILVY